MLWCCFLGIYPEINSVGLFGCLVLRLSNLLHYKWVDMMGFISIAICVAASFIILFWLLPNGWGDEREVQDLDQLGDEHLHVFVRRKL